MRLCTIVETKFNSEKDFETTFANWESEIAKFEFALQKDLYDEIKVGLLIAGTTGKLHDHLCFTLGDKVDYKAVRETVISYFKSKSLTTKRGYGGAEPMDIGALTTKGKPSWRPSTTSGKGKGSGKGRFCEYCKSTTHDTNY